MQYVAISRVAAWISSRQASHNSLSGEILHLRFAVTARTIQKACPCVNSVVIRAVAAYASVHADVDQPYSAAKEKPTSEGE
jgi:hypothetical protein